MAHPIISFIAASGRWARRGLWGGVLCAVLWAGVASAGGSLGLNNGARVDWRIERGGASPSLGLAIPAVADWTRRGFEKPVTIETRSDALAAVDAWEVGFYRLGDTDFARPLWHVRGMANTFGQPLEWDGKVEDGPSLRPGETVVARLSVRDVAGNVDHAAPQEMLISRYMMRRERAAVSALGDARISSLSNGERVQVPLQGHTVVLRLTDWPAGDEPAASGARLHKAGDVWVLRQIIPPGTHTIVIQSLHPIMGGFRAIPVGAISVEAPLVPPFRAVIKGTGALDKAPISGARTVVDGFVAEALVSGRQALSRMLTDRENKQDRLALALLPADARVPLARDERQRRALLASYSPETASWPGLSGARSGNRSPFLAAGKRMIVTYSVPMGADIFLPHTDIARGSVQLSVNDGGSVPRRERDYFVNADEGRVLLGEPVLTRLRSGEGRALTVTYTVQSFAPVHLSGSIVPDGGIGFNRVWDSGDFPPPDAVPAVTEPVGLLGSVMRWIFGDG